MPTTRRTTEPSDEDILAANAPPRRETDGARVSDRTEWHKQRYQTITKEQWDSGIRQSLKGPPDMTEYIGGGKLGRGPRPVKEPSPTPRFDPQFPYWQKPLHERKPGESIITYTPPMTSSEKKNARRGKNRGPGI